MDLIDRDRGGADLDEIGKVMNLDLSKQEAEAVAARSNMTNVVGMLHDRSSQFMDLLIKALEAGKLCVVDVSQMRGAQSFILSGLILRRIFDRNQEEFTKAEPRTIPTIAVIEEAQSVLNERAAAAEPYIAWVKEGRKYDLGALLITQQPGCIPSEILSQGDNWFIFHLLSAGDLASVKRANAHFSDDLLSSLLNEPIPGQGVFWSSVGGKPYPVSIRALLFEDTYKAADPSYARPAVPTFADALRRDAASVVEQARRAGNGAPPEANAEPSGEEFDEDANEGGPDLDLLYRESAVKAIRDNQAVMQRLSGAGAAWGHLLKVVEAALPDSLDDRFGKARDLVKPTLDAVFGIRDRDWHTVKHPDTGKVIVRKGPAE